MLYSVICVLVVLNYILFIVLYIFECHFMMMFLLSLPHKHLSLAFIMYYLKVPRVFPSLFIPIEVTKVKLDSVLFRYILSESYCLVKIQREITRSMQVLFR